MTIFDIVIVPFPFSDLRSKKKRPCLVLANFEVSELSDHIIVCMITSNLKGISFPHDIPLVDWEKSGLPKPSIVRLSKMVTIETSIVTKTIGHLSTKDQAKVRQEFKSCFQF